MNDFDVIVLGLGGVGSSAAFHVAKRGARVLGLERFAPGHAQGSSHGHTRIIRKAYFEHPNYVPLLERAYALWSELETEAEVRLFHKVGLLEIGPPDGVVIPGILASAEQHQLAVDPLSTAEVAERFPGFRVPDGHVAVFERDAGYLLVEDAVRTHAAVASHHGADVRGDQDVRSWRAIGNRIEVETLTDRFSAASLIIAAGAWSAELLVDLNVSLRVLRKHLHWFGTDEACYDVQQGCPTFFYEDAGHRYFYGFPAIDARGVKIAEHSGGTETNDPRFDDRSIDLHEQKQVADFCRIHLPGVSDRATDHGVCHYTMTPDEHFVVDRHPNHDNVVFAAGLSGHGFKFTSVLGELLADLALEHKSNLPIEFLNCQRFAK